MVQEFTLSRILAPFLKENPKIVKPRKNKTQLSILQPSFRFSHLAGFERWPIRTKQTDTTSRCDQSGPSKPTRHREVANQDKQTDMTTKCFQSGPSKPIRHQDVANQDQANRHDIKVWPIRTNQTDATSRCGQPGPSKPIRLPTLPTWMAQVRAIGIHICTYIYLGWFWRTCSLPHEG